VHVFGARPPGAEFAPVEPDLEDVYFAVMAGHQGARSVDARGAAMGVAS
jgi:ABC-2 type transport system ATP-binding protein